tara:strand:- start:7240 stop:8307 length:1068 start_codon:yes stop_codon:yes gene_type:complete
MITFLTAQTFTINVTVFALLAAVVWLAGSRIATYADALAERLGIGEAIMGVILLAGVTSLPEIATSLTAAHAGDAPLAVNNLLGSIAMQVTILALVDFTIRHAPLTSVLPDPVVMLQGALNIALLATVACAAIVGDISLGGAGAWSWLLAVATVTSLMMLGGAHKRPPAWVPGERETVNAPDTDTQPGSPRRLAQLSTSALMLRTVIAAAAILVAGYCVATVAGVLATTTGIGSNFIGFTFLAIATSLPEVSTALGAVRLGRNTMAISDIFGTNLLNAGLVFVVDIVAPGEAVFDRVGTFAAVAALLGIVVTAIFLIGLAERRDRTIGPLGIDSVALLIAYTGGLWLLYTLRATT